MYFELENRTWRQHYFTNALRKKNSCSGKKCRNDVQKFTPKKIFRGNLEFPGEFPPAVCLEETLGRGRARLGSVKLLSASLQSAALSNLTRPRRCLTTRAFRFAIRITNLFVL